MSARGTANSDIVESQASESQSLATLAAALERVPGTSIPQLVGPDEAPVDLPASLYEVLKVAVRALLAGDAVAIFPLHRLLTTTEAGDILGVSRQYLTRLLDANEIPHSFTGRHRRIKLAELLDYKRRRDAARRNALDELTAAAEAHGAYD